MEIIRGLIVVLHLIAFAALLGSWIVGALSRSGRITRLMQWSMVLALMTGLALAAPWGVVASPNYFKIGTKLVILLIIAALLGIGASRQRRGTTTDSVFWMIGPLVVINAAIAVLV